MASLLRLGNQVSGHRSTSACRYIVLNLCARETRARESKEAQSPVGLQVRKDHCQNTVLDRRVHRAMYSTSHLCCSLQ